MCETRAKPFVAWMDKGGTVWRHSRPPEPSTPVVVTPLLPDDPKPGEVWVDDSGDEHIIVGPPLAGMIQTYCTSKRERCSFPYLADLDDLTRKPVLKTFHANTRKSDPTLAAIWIDIRAESKEAALAQIADLLKEVK